MNEFAGETLSWRAAEQIVEVELHRAPANEIGSRTLKELEILAGALPDLALGNRALLLHSSQPAGFSAGADLRELHQGLLDGQDPAQLRAFLKRMHAVLNTLDGCPMTTLAAVHGVCFGGGFEVALACDLIIADKMARFCFPELRLGLIPGFGGIPRLRRDVGNTVLRDLLLTGRSLNATRAYALGLVSQLAGEGEALRVARATAVQVCKFDGPTSAVAKSFVKPIPYQELEREIEIFCELFSRPIVEAGLRQFVQSDECHPYLP